jgi:hypothetical protein
MEAEVQIVNEDDNPDYMVTFYSSDGDGETLFLKGLELRAGHVHEWRRTFEAQHPGQQVEVVGHARRWESLFYHEWLDSDEILDITLTYR